MANVLDCYLERLERRLVALLANVRRVAAPGAGLDAAAG
jgi:hypothetical protein